MSAFLLKGLQISVNGDLPWVSWVLIPTLQQADRMASLSTDQTQPITPPQSGGREHPRPDSTKLPADPSRSWSREGSLLLSILRAGNQPSHFYTVTQKQSRISSCIRKRSFLHSHNLNNFKTRNALASLLQTNVIGFLFFFFIGIGSLTKIHHCKICNLNFISCCIVEIVYINSVH